MTSQLSEEQYTKLRNMRITRTVSQGLVGIGLSSAYSFWLWRYPTSTTPSDPGAVGENWWDTGIYKTPESRVTAVAPGIVGGSLAAVVAMGVYALLDYATFQSSEHGKEKLTGFEIGVGSLTFMILYAALFATLHNTMKPSTMQGRVWTAVLWGIIAASLDVSVHQWY